MMYLWYREHDDNDDGVLDGIELLNAFAHETVPDLDAITSGLSYSEKMQKQKDFMKGWLDNISG